MSRGSFGREVRRPTPLIADDDPVERSMLGMALDDQFEIVATADNSDQAIEPAKEHKPDAALIDVDMPGAGGNTAVRGIADSSPETAIGTGPAPRAGPENDGGTSL